MQRQYSRGNRKEEAVNILDLLLGSDVGEIKLPTKEVEITRLSQVYGAPFILTIKAITPAKFEEIQDMSIDVKGRMQILILPSSSSLQ